MSIFVGSKKHLGLVPPLVKADSSKYDHESRRKAIMKYYSSNKLKIQIKSFKSKRENLFSYFDYIFMGQSLYLIDLFHDSFNWIIFNSMFL